MTAQQLRKSILQMAVQGKLVPQDPSDEPAHILLERIRAEKERLIKEKKIKKEKNPSVIYRGTDNLHYEKFADGTVKCIEDEIPFEIPESWAWVRLGTISTYAETKRKINIQEAPSDVWSLDLEDIEKGGRLLEYKTAKDRKTVGDRNIFKAGNILYSKLRPYLLKILIAQKDGICSSEIVPFSLYGGIISEYVITVLKCPYIDNFINSATYGVKMPRVSTETMSSLFIPIPSIKEQQRIVRKLNEATPIISEYDSVYSRVEELDIKFPQQLKKSILQWAVQGKLIQQDENDEPASMLLERIRAEKEELINQGKLKKDKHESVIFRRDNSYYERLNGVERCIDDEIPFEIPHNWSWSRLGAVFTLQAGKNIPSSEISEEPHSDLYPCYGGNGIRGFVSKTNRSGKHPIIGRQGALCGNINMATGEFYATEHAICVDTYCNTHVPWGCLFLEALNFNQYATATAQPGLSVSKINEVLIPIPPLAEQRRIYHKFETCSSMMQSW